jgi:hypothetical protein
MLKTMVVLMTVSVAACLLSGCGSMSASLGHAMGDDIPAWAGGLPAGAPPRPGDPGYADFEAGLRGKTATAPAKAPAEAPADEAKPAPSNQ